MAKKLEKNKPMGSVNRTLLEWIMSDVTVLTDAGRHDVSMECKVTRQNGQNELSVMITPNILLSPTKIKIPSGGEADDIVSAIYTSARELVNKEELSKEIRGILGQLRGVQEVVYSA